MSDELRNGWTAVPLDPKILFDGESCRAPSTALKATEISWPSEDPLVSKIKAYAEEHLSSQVYNHSMRVYYFSSVILKQQFPKVAANLSPSTLALACLLHDLGATEENMLATNMSFEFYGGIKAFNILEAAGSTKDQAAAVCECIIRHQDLGTQGSITFLGQLIQLATIYDNVSNHPYISGIDNMIPKETREEVIALFPRRGWLNCFAKTIAKETTLKPWCHTTHIPGFEDKILANKLMGPYE